MIKNGIVQHENYGNSHSWMRSAYRKIMYKMFGLRPELKYDPLSLDQDDGPPVETCPHLIIENGRCWLCGAPMIGPSICYHYEDHETDCPGGSVLKYSLLITDPPRSLATP